MVKESLSKTFLILLSAFFLTAALASACSGNTSDVMKENQRAEELWRTQNILNYTYTLDWKFRPDDPRRVPITIEVRDGSPQSMKYVDTGNEVPKSSDIFESVNDIGELFFIIRQADRGNVTVIVEYDDALGYPVDIRIGIHNGDPDSWGERLQVTHFEILK